MSVQHGMTSEAVYESRLSSRFLGMGRISWPAFVRYRSEREHRECEQGYPVVSTFLCRSGIGVADYSVSSSVEVEDPILLYYIYPLEAH